MNSMSWRNVGKKYPTTTTVPLAKLPVSVAKMTTTLRMDKRGIQDERIYDSLVPSDRKDALNVKETIEGTEFIPVRYTGRWRTFIETQKASLREQNTGRAPLFSKKADPLLDQVNTLFFGDSYARMLEPPPPNVYVVSYPGIPIKSITRSLTKEPKDIDKRRSDWLDTRTLSHEAKKKKIFLSFASKVPTRSHTTKKMFFSFDEGVKGNVGMHSYPRVDMFRQMLRFPSSALKYIMFWFGNAELQHTFYYDLFHLVMTHQSKDMHLPKDMNVREFESKYYGPFVQTYVKNSVHAYLKFLETVTKLEPTTVVVVVLLNYSPVRQREFRHLVPVKNVRSYGNTSVLDFIFDDRTRRRLVDFFNLHLVAAIKSRFSPKQVRLVDVNPLIYDYGKGMVKPEFVLDPRDIHLGDPKRNLYKFLVKALLEK